MWPPSWPRTPEALDLGALVKGLEPFIRRLVGSAVTVEVRPPAEAAVVVADASPMDQVVMNLVANAREAMPSGGTLTVEVQGSAKEVVLTVRDTGEGMDAATQERIFEPFVTTRPGRGGTGLGLATTRSIVEQCGGTITVTSAPGAGAKFRVTLPRSTETPVAGLSRVLAARQSFQEGAELTACLFTPRNRRRLTQPVMHAPTKSATHASE